MFDTLFTQSVELCITNVLFSFHLETPSPNFYLSNRLYFTLPVWSPLLLILFRVFQFAWNPAKNWPRSQLVIPSKFSWTHWKIMNSQSHFCVFYLFICQSISSFVSFTLFSLIDFFFVQCYHQRYQVLLLRLP